MEAGEIYFFTEDSPIGVKKHMHVCIKQMDSVLMFSACTRWARLTGITSLGDGI